VKGRLVLAAVVAVPALALAAALTPATPGSTTAAAGPGTFAFTQTSDRGFSYHVFLSDTGGAGRRLLTTRRAVGRPVISPNGRQVAFSGPLTDDSDGRYGIYVVNTDGTGLRLLTAPRFADFDPSWSADGRAIAFSRNINGNGRLSCCAIGLMYADGSAQHLVPGTTYGRQPSWTGVSHRLAYAAYDGLHTVNADGSSPALIAGGYVSWPAWSPDGKRIAYVRGVTASYSQVLVIGAAGGTPALVENLNAQAESPTWSLDSTTLYYVLFHGSGDEGRTDSSVWRSVVPGGGPTRLFSYGSGLTANVYGLSFNGPVQVAAKPTAVSWAPGRLDVFVRGVDSALYHKSFSGSAWSGWEPLGGRLLGNPHAVTVGPGRLDIFVRGTDSALYRKSFSGNAWSGWEPLGGRLGADPQAVSVGSGGLDVYVRGTDSALYHKSASGTAWSGWVPLGGRLLGVPQPVSLGSGRLDVYVRGIDSALYHKSYTSGWSGWVGLGGALSSDPAAAGRDGGQIDVAVRGTDAALYVKSYNGGWSGWRNIAGSLGSGPEAAFSGGGTDVTAVGSPPALPLLHSRGNAAGWGRVDQQAGPLGGTPESVSWGGGRLDVFYRSADGSLRHRTHDGATWSSEENLGGVLAAY